MYPTLMLADSCRRRCRRRRRRRRPKHRHRRRHRRRHGCCVCCKTRLFLT